VAWSLLCGTIFSNPCAGCGALASAAKAHIGPICTTCAAQVRSGTPNTTAWLRKQTKPAGKAPAGNIGDMTELAVQQEHKEKNNVAQNTHRNNGYCRHVRRLGRTGYARR
jgi:hypothetical protein